MKAIFKTKVDDLPVSIYQTNQEMGMAAAEDAAAVIKKAIQDNGHANIIIATGNSQLTFLGALSGRDDLDWPRINIFHMDEYVGMADSHPASFRRWLRERVADAADKQMLTMLERSAERGAGAASPAHAR